MGGWTADSYQIVLKATGEAADKQTYEETIVWNISNDTSISITDVSTTDATYSLSNDNSEIIIDYTSGVTENWQIKKLTEKTLKVSYTQEITGVSGTVNIKFDKM